MPGMGDEMDKAMQHAPHPGLQVLFPRILPALWSTISAAVRI